MRSGHPPSLDDIVELAEMAFASIPATLRAHVRGTAIVVEDAPDDDTVLEMGLDSPWDLTGLYRGTPLPAKSVLDAPMLPDTVVLYRIPILLEWIETGEDLLALVRNVLIHEIGHHFGFSDEDIARLEASDGD